MSVNHQHIISILGCEEWTQQLKFRRGWSPLQGKHTLSIFARRHRGDCARHTVGQWVRIWVLGWTFRFWSFIWIFLVLKAKWTAALFNAASCCFTLVRMWQHSKKVLRLTPALARCAVFHDTWTSGCPETLDCPCLFDCACVHVRACVLSWTFLVTLVRNKWWMGGDSSICALPWLVSLCCLFPPPVPDGPWLRWPPGSHGWDGTTPHERVTR